MLAPGSDGIQSDHCRKRRGSQLFVIGVVGCANAERGEEQQYNNSCLHVHHARADKIELLLPDPNRPA
jgi:hypothetical protein